MSDNSEKIGNPEDDITSELADKFLRLLPPHLPQIMNWISDRTYELSAIENGEGYLRLDPLLETAKYALTAHPEIIRAQNAIFGAHEEIGQNSSTDEDIEHQRTIELEIRNRLSPVNRKIYDGLSSRVESLLNQGNGKIYTLLDDPAFVEEFFGLMESSEYTGAVLQTDVVMTPQRRDIRRQQALEDNGNG